MGDTGAIISQLPLRMLYELVGRVFPDDPRLAWRLYEYFPRYRHAWGELRNQWNRLLGETTVHSIQGLIIEPTNVCNLRCTHCTPQNDPNLRRGMMKFELFRQILDGLPDLAALVLTWNGEPMAHPRVFDMIRLARQRGIHVCMFTNGTMLDARRRMQLMQSGLSELVVSMEGVEEDYEAIRGTSYSKVRKNLDSILKLRKNSGSSMSIRLNVTRVQGYEVKNQSVCDAWEGLVDYINFEPHMAVTREVRKSPCRTLFRSAAIAWDGRVSPCCVDMGQQLDFGKIDSNCKPLDVINGAEAQSIRERHLKGDFPEVCQHCPGFYG